MKQVLISQGKAIVNDVPAPMLEKGSVLVQVLYTCISAGTELSGVRESAVPLWKKALRKPEQVKKVVEMVMSQGLDKTRSLIEAKISSGQAVGYSAAGVVVGVGEGAEDEFSIGDLVACAGAQCAHHAEFISVPKNLSVRLPEKLGPDLASTVTLGAIALQGVRRAQPTLGESFVVIGLGILGQMTAQLLAINGCRVIGSDLDKKRVDLALSLGMDSALDADPRAAIEQVLRLTDGHGVDGVIITASSPSNAIISLAFNLCRKKGRVVLVGDVGLSLNREDFYKKELDFFVSTSYGPGRYDRKYEEEGLEYPMSYVRWTENRNMKEYLQLLARGKLNIGPLVYEKISVDDATRAYEMLQESPDKPLIVLLQYNSDLNLLEKDRKKANPKSLPLSANKVNIAVIGAGSFAKGMHLPNIASMTHLFQLGSVVSRVGHNAASTAKQFSAAYSCTDYAEVLRDPKIHAVLITTRHNLHASMVLNALEAGKHVLVEKPLAISSDELEQIKAYVTKRDSKDGNLPVLLTGFNRRFSPFVKRIHELLQNRKEPLVLNYTMNAGHIPADHWVHGPEGGGRNIGEACHIYDLFTYLTGAVYKSISTHSVRSQSGYYLSSDNFVVSISFADGSIATLNYTASGSSDYPKENLTVFSEGKVISLDNYKKLTVYGSKAKGMETSLFEKGQKEELQEFGNSVLKGTEWPIPFWQQCQAMEIAFKVNEALNS